MVSFTGHILQVTVCFIEDIDTCINKYKSPLDHSPWPGGL